MKLVKISINRFRPETPLSRDTFLFLPLNNKSVRIGLAGEGLRDSLLEKLKAKGYSHLHILEPFDIDPENFPVHQVPAVAEAAAPETRFQPGSPATEPEQRFRQENEGAPEGALVKGMQESQDNTENRFSADGAQTEKINRISGHKEEVDKTETRFGADKEVEPAVFRLSQALGAAEHSLRSGKRSISSGEKDQIMRDAKSVILSSKVADRILTFSREADEAQQVEEKATLRSQIRELRGVLETIELDGDTNLVSAAPELATFEKTLTSGSAEELAKASEKLAEQARAKEQAQTAMEKQEQAEAELLRSSTSRDLPATISRLAAYLGHSLGYTNIDFLTDLACGAVLHFKQKEGASFDTSQLPALSKQLLSNEEVKPSILTEDTKDVVLFLDAYIEDKECDRSQKDFVKKVFDRTVAELSKSESGPSIWNVKKWESFMKRGPTMDSHSICMRAAAKAQKIARAAIV